MLECFALAGTLIPFFILIPDSKSLLLLSGLSLLCKVVPYSKCMAAMYKTRSQYFRG